MSDKQYVECGVQTDVFAPSSAGAQVEEPAATLCRMISAVDIRGEPTTLSDLILSPSRSRRRSSSVSAHNLGAGQDPGPYVEEADTPAELSTTTREYKHYPLAHRFPKDRTLKSISSRIVSLPETSPLFSAKKTVARSIRIVSQPAPTTHNNASDTSSTFSDRPDTSFDVMDTFATDIHLRARTRILSNSTDLPHTPSPPSSPESILIIADKSQLPKGFLSDALEVDELPVTDVDSAWVKSPPRPIPALHGPLSLPYARCPSGAEGTIIDEQDNLPRMIWGLEGEEAYNNRNQSDSPSRITSHRKTAPRSTPNQVPPRFQRSDEQARASYPAALALPDQGVQYLSPLGPQHTTLHKPMSHADIDLSLPGHGPIDLSNVLRPRLNLPDICGQKLNGNKRGGLRDSIGYNDESVAGDWQAALQAQDMLNGPSFRHPSMSELGDYLVPSLTPSVSTSSVSSLQSLVHPHSTPSLDSIDRFSHVSSQALASATPRRMSALEIAQNYRQQQMHQKSMLPTPPNSSSPIWSSRFSPYQGSLVSPDLLAGSNLSGKHILSHRPDLLQHGNPQLLPPHSSPVIDLNSLKVHLGVSSLAPAAHIRDPTLKIHDLSSPIFNHDKIVIDPMRNHLRGQKHLTGSLASLPSPMSGRSPAPPRPPPNTPMVSAPLSRSGRSYDATHARTSRAIGAPLSPTSPDHRPRVSQQQQPRTAPPSQVLERRLPSVPEEDNHTQHQKGKPFTPQSTSNGTRGNPPRGHHEGPSDTVSRGARGARGHRAARGIGRGKRGHARQVSHVTRNGPERVDGGLTVRS
ncbi:hypothetical protein BXZ70DRAFT_913144 [Cristinia sonorae]|uniref:Uncharacterized protein n=1 Tax=Cristinia sonorae TaxID=1940300 RepID=A0A8K0XW47_9AGAR|nr:hypothetical protein BXZ70DRAFT_913144 [Cristinia sonorae]